MPTSKLKELYVEKLVTDMDTCDMFRILSNFLLKDYEKYDDTFIHSCILKELNECYDEKTVADFLQSVEKAELVEEFGATNTNNSEVTQC